jgi:hypothetical protein
VSGAVTAAKKQDRLSFGLIDRTGVGEVAGLGTKSVVIAARLEGLTAKSTFFRHQNRRFPAWFVFPLLCLYGLVERGETVDHAVTI